MFLDKSKRLKEAIKQAFYIAGTMHHAQNLNAVIKGLIEDDVLFDRKTAKVEQQIISATSTEWVDAQKLELTYDGLCHLVGGNKILLRNILPDFSQVLPGQVG